MTELEVAALIGHQRPALLDRRKDPGLFTVNELATLMDLFGWSGEEVMTVFRPEK